MSVKIGHASIDERGKASGGQAGDQTQREVYIREWYNKAWTHVLRPKKEAVANAIVKACKAACANDNIGYDQGQRTTLYTQAVAVGYALEKIAAKCECDCSSLVAVCVNAAGVKVSKDIYTGNMVAALKNTGAFDVLTDSKYRTSDKYLKAGDILVCVGHTAMVLENGASTGSTNTTNTVQPDTGKGYKVRITASVLNVRKGPGTNYGIATTVKNGEIYTITGEEKNGSTAWGRLLSGAGYISLAYTERA